jgi:hypothetical protein
VPIACACAIASEAQRSAALVAGRDERVAVGGLRPVVEQPLGLLALPGTQRDLAQVEPRPGVRGELASLVGERVELLEPGPSLVDVAAPDEALSRDPLGRLGQEPGRGGRVREPLAQVVDRKAPQAPRPREREQDGPLDGGAGRARSRESLERK